MGGWVLEFWHHFIQCRILNPVRMKVMIFLEFTNNWILGYCFSDSRIIWVHIINRIYTILYELMFCLSTLYYTLIIDEVTALYKSVVSNILVK